MGMNNASDIHMVRQCVMKRPEQMTMGDRVRQEREKRGLTIAELAAVARVGHCLISAIELNKRSGSIWTLAALAKSLNVSLDYLVGISNNR